ncbi:hypothetical protein AB0B39_17040 [Micromonospora sp. NPDC049114]|uniref:hypothetical protein n=1 Tax=Micromonospora sp. NPDC049114 TaxID=3155498 RepID=UPI0033CE4D21
MDAVPRIRAAHWANKDHVAALVADAVHPSPLATWLIPDPSPRRRILTDVLAIWIEHAMFYGDIYLTDDATAATVGFHRYRPISPPYRTSDLFGVNEGLSEQRCATSPTARAAGAPRPSPSHLRRRGRRRQSHRSSRLGR